MGVSEEDDSEKGAERIFEEIMTENVPKIYEHPSSSIKSR